VKNIDNLRRALLAWCGAKNVNGSGAGRGAAAATLLVSRRH
jgi:hypothetical protein